MIPTNDHSEQKDVEDVWNSEVYTLDRISGLSHRHLIQRIAAIERGRQRCLMFLWAEGGNLREFWTNRPKPIVTVGLVRDIIEQLRGMADALQTLHEYDANLHFRHGDIKPENILIFPDRDESRIGTLKISDLGSAKYHNVVTRLREQTGGKAWATIVYQPPEAVTNPLLATSRLYDIWSMGCVILEFMVWLLYGYEELKDFGASIKGKLQEPSSFFVLDTEQSGVAHIHHSVKACLDRLSGDPECARETALGDLLEIVKTKLLVVKLPPHTESATESDIVSVTPADANNDTHEPFGTQRSSARVFVNALNDILRGKNATNDRYWCTGKSRDNVRRPSIIPNIVTDDHSSPSHLFARWTRTPPATSGAMVDRPRNPSLLNASASLVVPKAFQHVRTRSLNSRYFITSKSNILRRFCSCLP